MKKSLLAHIASNFISEYENVANSSIAYLLNEYPSARKALSQLLTIENLPSHFVTELTTKSNGRLDVAGLNENGNISIIIEGKFWASLTDNQPNSYLKELKSDGILLFLAPDLRLSSLKSEIEKRLEKPNSQIVIHSWSTILSAIETENSKGYSPELASDLFQMKELCKKMDIEGMPPLSLSDLDPVHGRVCSNFANIIPECNATLRNWEYSDFKGTKTTSSQYGHGFYFRAFNFGCSLDFSTYKWYTTPSQTPFWLKIQNSVWEEDFRIQSHLKTFDEMNTYKVDSATAYAIVLSTGMDKKQVTQHIVEKVKDVLGYLNDQVS